MCAYSVLINNVIGIHYSYCMREMIQKIPEGDWLCEECKFAEETEKQKQGRQS